MSTKRLLSGMLRALKRLLANRRFQRLALAAGVLFIVINGVIYLLYHDRTYPNTRIAGREIGTVSRQKLSARLDDMKLLPESVTFKQGKDSQPVSVATLGITTDKDTMVRTVLSKRSWLPLANLLTSQDSPIVLKDEPSKVTDVLEASLTAFRKAPEDARVGRDGARFVVQPDSPGLQVDTEATRKQLLQALGQGQSSLQVATKKQPASVTMASLQDKTKKLNDHTRLAISLRYADKTKKFSPEEIANWYVEENTSMALSQTAIQTAIITAGRDFGIRVANLAAASQSISQGLQDNKAVTAALEAAPAGKRLTYCTAVRGVDPSEIPAMEAKLAATFSDSRGWGLDGLVQFDKVGSGCDFTVWLAAADQMSSFGAICDAEWSCMYPPNVVINFDRWRNASTAWNNQGGTLQDYRAMVINHETGHWLGFYHASCPGAGQQAPVMQQQSIDLQGCTFNPWPSAVEKSALQQKFEL